MTHPTHDLTLQCPPGTLGHELVATGPVAGLLAHPASRFPLADRRFPDELLGYPDWLVEDLGADAQIADLVRYRLTVAGLLDDRAEAVSPEGAAKAAEVERQWAAQVLEWAHDMATHTLERELGDLLSFSNPARGTVTKQRSAHRSPEWVQAIGARIGAWGQPPATLDEAAKPLFVTRERVRQVMVQLTASVEALQPLWLPQLDAVADVAAQGPRSEEDLAAELVARGITEAPFTLAALTSVAQFAGHDLVLTSSGGVVGADPVVAAAVREATRKLCTLPGVGTYAQVRVLAEEELGRGLEESIVRELVDADTSLRWCAPGSFRGARTPAGRVRLRNIARAMLSAAAGPITVEDVRVGYERKNGMRTRRRPVDPTAVGPFLADHPDFAVDGRGVVTSTVELDYRTVLGAETSILVDVLREADGHVMDRNGLLDACVARGMNRTTAGMWLTFHEIMTPYGWAVWGLVGASPSPALVTSIQEQVRAGFEPSHKEDGWDERGRPWFRVRLTRSVLATAVISFAWHAFMAGRSFDVVLPDGQGAGRVSFGDGHQFVWGWAPVLALTQARRGQVLTAVFDLAAGTVHVEVV